MQAENPGEQKKVTIWSMSFVALIIVNFFRMMGQALANTALPLYAYDLGAAATMVGFVSGAFAISAILIRPFIGPAFDSFSKTKLFLIFGIELTIAGYSYAFVHTVPMIIFVRLLHGIGMGCTAPLGMAIASDILPEEKMNSGLSIYSLSQSTALAIGPGFAIWAVDALGYFATFMITGSFMAACCVVVCIFVKEPPVAQRPPYKLSLSRAFAKRAIPMSCVVLLMAIPFSCVGSFLAIYGELQGISQVGLFFTVNAGFMLITRPLVGRLADKVGANKVIIPTMVMFAVSYVLLGLTDSFGVLMLAALASAFGYGAASPLVQAVIFQCVPASQRGSASNTNFLGMDTGNLIGPYLGGFIIELLAPIVGSEAAAYSMMWFVMLIPIFAGLALFIALRGRVARYEQEALEENHRVAAAIQEPED